MEQEESKFWHYSTEKLFELFVEELITGKLSFSQI